MDVGWFKGSRGIIQTMHNKNTKAIKLNKLKIATSRTIRYLINSKFRVVPISALGFAVH